LPPTARTRTQSLPPLARILAGNLIHKMRSRGLTVGGVIGAPLADRPPV
jgi:hypothetical protein